MKPGLIKAFFFNFLILQLYSAGFTGDLREVVTLVGSWYPKAKLYAVGWSIGANILVQYLGQVG